MRGREVVGALQKFFVALGAYPVAAIGIADAVLGLIV